MSQVELGQLRSGGEKRDAVHVAIYPMVCKEDTLMPGEYIRPEYHGCENAVTANSETAVGVVDPMLKRPLRRGDEFWMVLFPGTVQNLRHAWDHELLPNDGESEDYDDYDDGCQGC